MKKLTFPRSRIIAALTALVVILTTFGALKLVPLRVDATTMPDYVIIYQVYAMGDNTDGAVSHSFVELYNPTDNDIDISNYSIQARSVSGSWDKLNLSGTINSKCSFLIRCTNVQSTASRYAIPDSKKDMDWDIQIDSQGFEMALVSDSNLLTTTNTVLTAPEKDRVIDLLGAYNNNPADVINFEGTAFGTVSKDISARRKSFTDTDDNSVDFTGTDYRSISAERLAEVRPRGTDDGPWNMVDCTAGHMWVNGVCQRDNAHTCPDHISHNVGRDCITAGDDCAVCELAGEAALGHDETGAAATCTTDKVCAHIKCDHVLTTALGHTLPTGTWTDGNAATCTAASTRTEKCARIGCTFMIATENQIALGHDWSKNNDGTHSCIRIGGCGTTNQTCSPNTPGDTCTTCSYFTPTLNYIISLGIMGTYTFTAATTGYSPVAAHTVTVKNEGSQATGTLTVALSGTNPTSFTLSKNSIGSIAVNSNDTFTIKPNDNLSVGTYTATVTISGDNGISGSFNVSFTVSDITPGPNPIYTFYTVTFNGNGGTTSETTRSVSGGDAVGELPTAKRDGHSFKGWFTEKDGGAQISESTAINDNITFFAGWTADTRSEEQLPPEQPPTEQDTKTEKSRETPSEKAVELINNAKDGDTVTITLTGDNTTLTKEVFETIAGRDITLHVKVGDATWIIYGKDVPTEGLKDINMGIAVGVNTVPIDIINLVTGERSTIQISLEHNGPFGFTMKLLIPLGTDNAGYYANLYYYNKAVGKMEFRASTRIAENGNAILTFTGASVYTIYIDDKDHALKSPKTGDNSNLSFTILMMALSVIGIISTCFASRAICFVSRANVNTHLVTKKWHRNSGSR